ncbi:MAG: PQQ-dependent sugar dehydrogenase [SAR324 cluster bacterium]|nr:PQQ-dependent sugar dehydrogenase [SAR324 cluster bacterium]
MARSRSRLRRRTALLFGAIAAVFILLPWMLRGGCTYKVSGENLERIRLPPGFAISIYARVPGARTMAVLPSSRAVIVGTRSDKVYAAIDRDGDFTADEVVTLYAHFNEPNGVAYRDGYLYVAERHRILRVKLSDADLAAPPPPRPIYTGLPGKAHHGTRYLAFGPDGRLYVALGSPCNICRPDSPADAIVSLRPDGSDFRLFAEGVRNSVGMDFHPATGELFFTDNGADRMGDDSPPDEFNHAPRAGLHFGFPWYGGGRDRTAEFRGQEPPRPSTFPVVEFQAHVAALGMHFYRGDSFPAQYRHDAFVAQHGSWDRTTPVGYRVMRIRFDDAGNPAGKEVFAEGWLQGRSVSGRPMDIEELADGSLLVSDDGAGLIYRIRYVGE